MVAVGFNSLSETVRNLPLLSESMLGKAESIACLEKHYPFSRCQICPSHTSANQERQVACLQTA
jgi:hypothetical protein